MSAADEVKARLDIVEVVGQHVRLQKAGRSFKGLCPFHTEKTPSFIVNPDRQTWHCFGACSTGGDVIAFIARKENLDFGGALRLLAERAGVVLETNVRRREEIRTLEDANEAAALYFHNLLLRTPSALAYAAARGLDRAAIDDFQLGLAPSGWENLKDYLAGRGFKEAQLVEAGLLVESERGTTYDRFRERLVFPVRGESGRVIAFGARVLPGAAETGAKYINTPQTPIFDKSGILYGLDRARDEIRRSGVAVIVEGYMDVIAAHQHGFRNVVASMGTALTERQALLLRRFAERVVLAMDADEAGNAATIRAVQVVAGAAERRDAARSAGRPVRRLEVGVAALPEGVDPDDLIRKDPGQWEIIVKTGRPVIDHLYAVVTRGRDLADARERDAVIAELLPAIAELPSPVQQADWVQRLARGRVAEETLWRQLRESRRRRSGRDGDGSGAQAPAASLARRRLPREEFCLALVYRFPELAPLARDLEPALFSHSENRELYERWRRDQPVEENDPLAAAYERVLETRIPPLETEALQKAFLDCVARLEDARMKAIKEASSLALAEGEAGVSESEVVAVARSWLDSGVQEETLEDEALRIAASSLLEDMEAGLQVHRRQLRGSRPDRPGRTE